MPLGLCNVPATFQRLMDPIYREQIGQDVLAYLDDLLMDVFDFHQILPIFEVASDNPLPQA